MTTPSERAVTVHPGDGGFKVYIFGYLFSWRETEASANVIAAHVRKNLDTFAADAVRAARERIMRAFCPDCTPSHVLDNGRVWYFCGTTALETGIPEKERAAIIRARTPASGEEPEILTPDPPPFKIPPKAPRP